MAELLKWDNKSNKKVVVDTNLLLDDSKILYKLINKYDKIIIPSTVLKELDKHKFKDSTSYSARQAIRAMLDFKREFPEYIEFNVEDIDVDEDKTNDVKIIKCAEDNKATLVTKDMSMSIIAESKQVDTELYDIVLNNLFDPYIYIDQEKLFENSNLFNYNRIFSDEEYYEILDYFSEISKKDLDQDMWFFIIINTPTSNPTIYANNPINKELIKIDDNPKYRLIEVDNTRIKARDIFQTCAIFALKEAQHVLITGKWGSGKTLLASAQAIASSNNQKKVFISRAPIGLNSKYNLGYLPGGMMDKMQDWLAGFLSAAYYIYSNTRGQDTNQGYDHIKEIVFRDKFEPVAINSIQGLSLLDEDILIVDECQLIDINYMSMILSRPSESGRLILLGDLGQTYGVVKPSESGLLKLLRILPHQSIAYVQLNDHYRSEILDLADKLQDKTIG